MRVQLLIALQRLSALAEAGQAQHAEAPSPQQQDRLCCCMRDVGALVAKLAPAGDSKGERPFRMSRELADDDAALHGMQVRARACCCTAAVVV